MLAENLFDAANTATRTQFKINIRGIFEILGSKLEALGQRTGMCRKAGQHTAPE